MAPIEDGIIRKLKDQRSSLINSHSRSGNFVIYYSRKVGYFLQILDFIPIVRNGKGELRPPTEFKELHFSSKELASAANASLNSNLFYWFVTVFADCRHVNKREVDLFPIKLDSLIKNRVAPELFKSISALMADVQKNSQNKTMSFKHDTLTVQCIFIKLSKPLINQIDTLLAVHYGFTQSELDFIINYDIKYRMGKELEGGKNNE
jgi:hypothetical protein